MLSKALLLLSGACAGWLAVLAPVTPAAGDSGSGRWDLGAMAERLDEMAGAFEDDRDVKCWTSFKKLETFVAGCQLDPGTTHLKAEVVMSWLDQVWAAAAAEAAGDVVDVATWHRIADARFPRDEIPWLETVVLPESVAIRLPWQDVDNYLGTVEPVRLLQMVTRHVAETDPDRPPLAAAVLEGARDLAATLAAAVLKDANREARRRQGRTIEDADILAVDARVAEAAGLRPYDPERSLFEEQATSPAQDPFTDMRATIARKVDSLDRFNTAYTRDRLGGTFSPDLARHEAQWAGRPVDPAVSETIRTELLVELAERSYLRCVAEHQGSDPLSGPEMLETLLGSYPFVTTFEGFVNLFPDETNACNLWVEEFQADAFRDTGWHWRSLGMAVDALVEEGRFGPVMDLYAMEELTEFLSVYAVAVLRAAGTWAEAEGHERVDAEVAATAHGLFEQSRLRHEEGGEGGAGRRVARSTRVADGPDRVRAALAAAYIDELFSDVTASSGLDFEHETSDLVHDFRFREGGEVVPYLAERNQLRSERGGDGSAERVPNLEIGIGGGGVTAGDVDGDGRLDVYLVSGRRDRLYLGAGDRGTIAFRDVTGEAGLVDDGEGRGAYLVDVDNDGDQDLFVTQLYAPNRLMTNDGRGRFQDATEAVGLPLATDRLSHSATWFDYDNDGHLDVYVGQHGDWLAGDLPMIGANSRNGQPNRLFRADGEGGFTDVTEKTGTGDPGWAHAVSHFDADGDGWQDLYVANDFGEDVLLRNELGRRFRDVTPGSLENEFLHGMSVGFTDANRDGIDDVYVSNIAMFTFNSKYILPGEDTHLVLSRRTVDNARMAEKNVFLVSEGGGLEQSEVYFDLAVEGTGWAWDADFLDVDNDGEEDLYIANGREPNLSYDGERNVLFKQLDRHFYDVSRGSGADIAANSRGVVHADLEGDGDLDLVVNNYLAPATVLRNDLQRHHWIGLDLVGTSANRDAIGARVYVRSASGTQVRTVRGGSGFLSKEPCRLHVGLGEDDRVERVGILWPGGTQQVVEDLAADRVWRIVQAAGETDAEPVGR